MESSITTYGNVVIAEEVKDQKLILLEKKIQELIQENEKLSLDNERIINSIGSFAPYLGDDYQWICIDKACLTASEPRMNDNPFSGESFSYHDMKKRMITQNYWGCYVSEDLKCYYTPAKYKYILSQLVPVPISKNEKSVFYIRIPKIDMKTNKDGFGLLRSCGGEIKKYHGNTHHISKKGQFIVRKDKLRNIGWDILTDNNNTRDLPYTGECDNIQYDAELYCTNCKCISEGSNILGSWKLYQCMGH